jgi:hypothetical protein
MLTKTQKRRFIVAILILIVVAAFIALTIMDFKEMSRQGQPVEAGPMNFDSADAEPDYCSDMTRRACRFGERMICEWCPNGAVGVQSCNKTCTAWTVCECPIGPMNYESQPKGSGLMMGARCDCSVGGQKIMTDLGLGYCLDGIAVTEHAYEKFSQDPKFEYTVCPDPRKKDGIK